MAKPRIEFYISPDGKVMIGEAGKGINREFTEKDIDLTEYIAALIEQQYPTAYKALELEYRASMVNKIFYRYLIVHRFIRCNFSKFDGLTYDIDEDILHIEDIPCPLKFRNDCPLRGIVCRPKPFGLSDREREVAKMSSSGKTYKEISRELGITRNTISSTIGNIKRKLHLSSSKDVNKLFSAIL